MYLATLLVLSALAQPMPEDGGKLRFLRLGSAAFLTDGPDGEPLAEIAPVPGEEIWVDLYESVGRAHRVRIRGEVEIVGWLDAPTPHALVARTVTLWSSARRSRRLGHLHRGAEVVDRDAFRELAEVDYVDPEGLARVRGWIDEAALVTSPTLQRASAPELAREGAALLFTSREVDLAEVLGGRAFARLRSGTPIRFFEARPATADGGAGQGGERVLVERPGLTLEGWLPPGAVSREAPSTRTSARGAPVRVSPPVGVLYLTAVWDAMLRLAPDPNGRVLARLSLGVPVEELRRAGDYLEVRTLAGVITVGWLDASSVVPALP